MSAQQENLERVSTVIAAAILQFHSATGLLRPFRCEELRRFVISQYPRIAPASPDRVLRDLRKRGLLDYHILNRRGSLYEFTS